MRSFHQVIVFLFALLICVFAQSSDDSYEATVYVTSTITRVNTVTASGASPTGSVANQTSTIRYTPSASYSTSYNTTVAPTGSAPTGSAPTRSTAQPSPSQFVGAASALNVNALLAALVAGVGYLAL